MIKKAGISYNAEKKLTLRNCAQELTAAAK